MSASALLLGASASLRIASLNLCTDELLLAIAEPRQIVSVTHLARSPAETPLWRQAQRYRPNDGSLLSVAAMRPTLAVTMGGGARDQLRIAPRLGMRTLNLPFAQSLDELEQNIRKVARAVGRQDAGARLLQRIAALRASAPRSGVDTIWLGGGGRTVSATGLEAQWMALAGLDQRRMRGDRVSLETLLTAPPAILLRSDYRAGQYSAAQRWLSHPVARLPRKSQTIATDGRAWTCMGPPLIQEVERLRLRMRR